MRRRIPLSALCVARSRPRRSQEKRESYEHTHGSQSAAPRPSLPFVYKPYVVAVARFQSPGGNRRRFAEKCLLLAAVKMGTRDDEYDYLFKGKSPLRSLSLTPFLYLSLSVECVTNFFFSYSEDDPHHDFRSAIDGYRSHFRRGDDVRHVKRHLVNDDRPRSPVRGETRAR